MDAHPAPGFAEFRQDYEQGRGHLLWRRAVADLDTPVAVFLKLAHGKPNTFLLESVEGGASRGRYSIVGLQPDLVWRCRGGRAELNRHAQSAPYAFAIDDRTALDSLRAVVAESHMEVPEGLPPMCGGLIGYLGYDMVRLMEHLPNKNQASIDVPDALLARPTLFAIFDNVTDLLTLAAPPVALPPLQEPSSNFTRDGFVAAVERAKEYIRAGDAFQIVPSQRFSVPFALPPFALYRALRRISPAPFLFFLDFGGFAVVGSSPEILVRLRDGTVTIRPLAGTRRRGTTHAEDQILAAELLADPKERAEHLMLLDLGRNDVGRVAELGTVRVTESFAIERFSHVMHIASDVQGTLRAGLDAIDALAAGFPAGTLTGAPKVRAMEIIEELEPTRRGIYAGCIGYFAANGTMDTCIGLRTAVVKDGTMHVQAGAGIVADSDPQAEYEETRQKAQSLLRAAEEAVRFAAGKGT